MRKRIIFAIVFLFTIPLFVLMVLVTIGVFIPIIGIIWVIKGNNFNYDKFFNFSDWVVSIPWKVSGIEEI